MKKYQIIYADPPWLFNQKVGIHQDGGRPDRFTSDKYVCMTLQEIMALPIHEITDRDCALFMWSTDAHLPEALEVIKAWGFRYKTIAFVWVKRTNQWKLCANIGAWTMKNAEICLIGTKGNMVKYKKKRDIYQVIESQRTAHSKKPAEVRRMITDLFGDLPRIELFARKKVEGWDCWGNEVESDIDLTVVSSVRGETRG